MLFCLPRGWIGGFSNRRALCAPNHLSVLTLGQFEQVQPCAIKRIHPPRKSVLFCTVFLFIEKPLPFSSIFVVLPRNRYSLSKQARLKHKATISLYRLLGVDFFVRFFFVERGGLAVCQTAVRCAHRTTFRCAHFALASKLARSLLSESTPNIKERIARCVFFFVERGGFGGFLKTATRFACRTTFSVLTLRFFMFLLFVAAGLIRK